MATEVIKVYEGRRGADGKPRILVLAEGQERELQMSDLVRSLSPLQDSAGPIPPLLPEWRGAGDRGRALVAAVILEDFLGPAATGEIGQLCHGVAYLFKGTPKYGFRLGSITLAEFIDQLQREARDGFRTVR